MRFRVWCSGLHPTEQLDCIRRLHASRVRIIHVRIMRVRIRDTRGLEEKEAASAC